MTDNQHTPGPWAAYCPDSRWQVRGQDDGTPGASRFGALVAECFASVAKADAALIAEAPAMVEIVRGLEESFTADNSYHAWLPQLRATLARIDGAGAE